MRYITILIVLISFSAFAKDQKPALPKGVSQACKVDSDCIVAYDQCGRCYSINKNERSHLEAILFRACSVPANKMRAECVLTQAKCEKDLCQ